jgi:excisionase family DNA binding protein
MKAERKRKLAGGPVAVQGQSDRPSGGDGTSVVGVSASRTPKYDTVQEAAKRLFISDAAVRKLLTQKVLRRFKVCGLGAGRRTLLLSDEVDALVVEAE